jgi:hypothetical protein
MAKARASAPPTGLNEEGLPLRAALPLSSRDPADPQSVAQATRQIAWTPIEGRIQLTDAGDRGDGQ